MRTAQAPTVSSFSSETAPRRTSLCYIVRDLGHYHNARLQAAAARRQSADVVVVEICNQSPLQAFNLSPGEEFGYERQTLFPGQLYADIRPSQMRRSLLSRLNLLRPHVIAIPGWSAMEALVSLSWAVSKAVSVIVASESQCRDHRRNSLTETVKRRVASLCSAALVGGPTHAKYATDLGIAGDHIFFGYDVVDNGHFAHGVEKVRRDGNCRSRLHLPEHFFLTCCRFVPEKNLLRLLDAYARYRKRAAKAWSLVVVGDGPLWGEVQAAIRRLELESWVLTPGYMQYETLPAYYGLADAFLLPSVVEPWGLVVNEAMAAGLPVLVSQRCGCAPDLVEAGKNGWTFDPYDVDGLAELMVRVSRLPEEPRGAMGRASREIITRWSPETFAEGLWRAVEAAQASPLPRPSAVDQSLLWLLMRR